MEGLASPDFPTSLPAVNLESPIGVENRPHRSLPLRFRAGGRFWLTAGGGLFYW
jgi:hypothetical protein